MAYNEDKNPAIKLAVIAIIGIILLVVGFNICNYKFIHGNELGVKETWSDGVEEKVYQPGMHWLVPAWSQKIITYDASSQIFVMNDKGNAQGEKGTGREKDAYHVQSKEGQNMGISLNLRWRLDPSKLVSIHKTVRTDIEEKIIRPVVMRVVKDEATKMTAIEAYSGEGLVRLQSNIQSELAGKGEGAELSQRGIIVENFVIEHIELDPAYISEITQKQVATQKALRSVEEQKAAEAQALVAKSLAQADLNKAVVEAERDKQVKILAAQAANESTIIAAKAANESAIIKAKAEQQKLVLEAEGKRDADIAQAKGVIALGEAQAKATTLKLQAYSVKGSDLYTRVEVAKQLGIAFSNVKGYLPSIGSMTLLGDNFQQLLDKFAGPQVAEQTAIPPHLAETK